MFVIRKGENVEYRLRYRCVTSGQATLSCNFISLIFYIINQCVAIAFRVRFTRVYRPGP